MPLLKEDELDNIVHKYDTLRHINDNSICSRLFTPLWSRAADRLVPADVSPNALSLGALLCLLQAAYLCYFYYEVEPKATTLLAGLLIFAFWTLDSLDAIHADNVGSKTSLTLVFDSFCSSVGTVFLTVIVCWCFGIKDAKTLWYAVQTSQLILLNKHIRGAVKQIVSYWLFNGPGELVSALILLLLVRATFGLELFGRIFDQCVDTTKIFFSATGIDETSPYYMLSNYFLNGANVKDAVDNDPFLATLYAWRVAYFAAIAVTVFRTVTMTKSFHETRIRLGLCLAYRMFPALLMWLLPMRSVLDGEYGFASVLCDGLFMAVVTTDVLVCRMAKRQLHPWVVLMGMVSLVSSATCLMFAMFYAFKLFTELCNYSNESLLSSNINVYCDGVYDLCHEGHMAAYRNALKHGTRLFVGVCSDEDVMSYKRAPVMTADERARAVSNCKFVSKVIRNPPCQRGLLDKAFIQKHNIHIVVCGEEYDNSPANMAKRGGKEDLWYKIPRDMGILRHIPRTDGVSTSTLIKRIQARYETEGVDSPKDKLKLPPTQDLFSASPKASDKRANKLVKEGDVDAVAE
jgi:choline-phosphate cytidylyltransferase